MKLPDELTYMIRMLHQDILLDVSTEQGLVAYAVRALDADQRRVVHAFLTELLAKRPTGDELLDLWFSTEPDIAIYNGEGVRWFLSQVRDRTAGPTGADRRRTSAGEP